MNSFNERIKLLTEELKDFVEAKFELSMLKVTEKISFVVGDSIQRLFGIGILALAVIFGSISGGFYLSELLESEALGFLCVAGLYLFLGILFALIKPKSISKKIQDQIMNEVIKSFEDEKPKSDVVKHLESPLKKESK